MKTATTMCYFVSESNESHGFVTCKAHQGEGYQNNFFGPELGLSEKLNELYPDETFFIIKWAWSGTNLYDQWRSLGGGSSGGPLYESFVQYVNNSLEFLRLKNYNVRIEAMCGMQGESDALEEQIALDSLIKAGVSNVKQEEPYMVVPFVCATDRTANSERKGNRKCDPLFLWLLFIRE